MLARVIARTAVLLCLTLSVSLATHPAGAVSSSFSVGDVFVGVGSNTVQWRLPDGTLNKKLTTATSSSITTGMGFDGALATGKLYVTGYTSNVVNRFTTVGQADGTFGGGYNSHPESITFDRNGNVYVGQERGARAILKFNSAGTLLASYAASGEGTNGTDRIDLAADQCTIYYTSGGKSIRRFNVCTNAQGANVTSLLPGKEAFDVRLLPRSDQMLVADSLAIYRVSGAGTILQTYDQPSRDCWVGLALDQTAATFWAADRCASRVYRFDTTTGSVITSFATNTKSGSINGLGVFGGATAARSPDNNSYIPPEGGSVTTEVPGTLCPSQDVQQCSTVTYPMGPGGVAGVSLPGPLDVCGTLFSCLGSAVNADPVPEGYTDSASPIKVVSTYFSGLAGGRTDYSVLEQRVDDLTGQTVTVVVPPCQPAGKTPSFPCLASETLEDGNTVAEIWMLSGDPKFQLFG